MFVGVFSGIEHLLHYYWRFEVWLGMDLGSCSEKITFD